MRDFITMGKKQCLERFQDPVNMIERDGKWKDEKTALETLACTSFYGHDFLLYRTVLLGSRSKIRYKIPHLKQNNVFLSCSFLFITTFNREAEKACALPFARCQAVRKHIYYFVY